MNDNVTGVVDLLFRDIEESEEVMSIRDEIMNNCQERYDNMIASGYSEEEALGAVADSLKGMDEVLKDYPRKRQYTEADFSKEKTGGEERGDDVGIDWDILRAFRINVRSANVEVCETEGRQTLEMTQGAATRLEARMEGDALVITQEPALDRPQAEAPRDNGILGMLAKLLENAIRSFPDGEESSVRILLPRNRLRSAQIHTLSGDIRFEASADSIDLQTASGECSVSVPVKNDFADGKQFADVPDSGNEASGKTPALKAASISGGVDVHGDFSSAVITTTSGDIEFIGTAGELKFKTVSGDIDADTVSAVVSGSSVSGDIELADKIGEGEIRLESISGDIEVELPNAGGGIRAEAGTRSGDVNYYNIALRDDAPLKVRLKTVSGDVTVQG